MEWVKYAPGKVREEMIHWVIIFQGSKEPFKFSSPLSPSVIDETEAKKDAVIYPKLVTELGPKYKHLGS